MDAEPMLPLLRDGDCLGVVAPASPFDASELEPALGYLRDRGFDVHLGQMLCRRHRYLAGTDEERLADLHAMFADPHVRAVFCARGGYGSGRLLDRLDYRLIRRQPKLLVGFSDITALQLALYCHCRLPSLSAGTLCADIRGDRLTPRLEETLWAAARHWRFAPIGGLQPLRPGRAAGPLLGGCLSLVCALVGTPHLPDMAGAVLVLEDVNEPPYRVDRMFNQLRQSGVLSVVAGLVCGVLGGPDDQDPEVTAEIVAEYAGGVSGPVLTGLPYGHVPDRVALPLGARAELDAQAGTLSIISR